MHVDTHTHHVPLSYIARVSEDPKRFEATVAQTSSDTYEMVPSFWSSARFASRYRFAPPYYDWQARVDHMDSTGIRAAVVSANQALNYAWAPLEVAVEVAQLVNDDLAEGAKRFPGRIHGIASVPLQDPDAAVREATRAIDELGLRGIQVLSSIEGANLANAGLEKLFECVAGLEVPLFIHPYGALNHERMTPHFLVNVIGFPTEQAMAAAGLIFEGVLDRYTNLKVFLGHGGGSFPYLLGRIERGMQAFPDLMSTQRPFRDYLDQIFVDTLVHDDAALKYLIETLGIERVMFGTDWPYWMQDTDVLERVERVMTTLGHDVFSLSDTASRLFGPFDLGDPIQDGQS
ncbi:MAG: amidohydrolase family protein [Acidimicrobiia bacterium]|nr:amidohydrolase family protein [Acidimicrobiia bacterium]